MGFEGTKAWRVYGLCETFVVAFRLAAQRCVESPSPSQSDESEAPSAVPDLPSTCPGSPKQNVSQT